MKRSVLAYLFTASLLVITGCVSSNYMAVGGQTYPPRPNDYIIDVYVGVDAPVIVQQSIANARSNKEVPSNAVLIGRVDTVGAPAASWGALIEDAKRKARVLGGDGLVIGQWGSQMTGIDNYGNAYYGKNLAISVVRYRS